MAPVTIDCRRLPAFKATSLDAVRAAFRDATPIPLAQAWLASPEPDFARGTVRTGWREDALLVFGRLSDADIHTRARRHNERFWELGDTFEMFLQPEAGQPYVELHVTPNNLRLQLRFTAMPSPVPGPDDDRFEAALIHANVFDSHTWVNHAGREWCVLADIPAAVVAGLPPGGNAAQPSGAAPSLAGSSIRFSFSRYDYTRGRERPVISSSSPHAEPRFHRQHEWGVLRFGGNTAA